MLWHGMPTTLGVIVYYVHGHHIPFQYAMLSTKQRIVQGLVSSFCVNNMFNVASGANHCPNPSNIQMLHILHHRHTTMLQKKKNRRQGGIRHVPKRRKQSGIGAPNPFMPCFFRLTICCQMVADPTRRPILGIGLSCTAILSLC